MKTVQEVSKLSGVSVRTLHYYDEIGLLAPTSRTESGYWLYDAAALRRLEQILLYRELDFSLKEIGAILSRPDFDRAEALMQQERLLLLRRKHLDKLIGLTRKLQKEESHVDFEAFDKQALREYEQEVRCRWGETPAFNEFDAKTEKYGENEWEHAASNMEQQFAAFERLVGQRPDAEEVQRQVAELQDVITRHYYQCSNEILASLGQMYLNDKRFLQNIDRRQKGTAQLVSDAIAIYCAAQK